MFDVAWQELLIVGIVALVVVGPKELPTLLRTIGKYMGVVKRQAAEFRAQFDEAMKESELDQLRKDVEKIKSDAEGSLRDVEHHVGSQVSSMKGEFDAAAQGIAGPSDAAAMHDANGLPMNPDTQGHTSVESAETTSPTSSAGAAAIAAAAAAAAPPPSSKTGA